MDIFFSDMEKSPEAGACSCSPSNPAPEEGMRAFPPASSPSSWSSLQHVWCEPGSRRVLYTIAPVEGMRDNGMTVSTSLTQVQICVDKAQLQLHTSSNDTLQYRDNMVSARLPSPGLLAGGHSRAP